MIDFINVNKVFKNDNREDIKDINIKINKGDIFGFVGKDVLEISTPLGLLLVLMKPKGILENKKTYKIAKAMGATKLETIRYFVFKGENYF